MGNTEASYEGTGPKEDFGTINDTYKTYEELQEGLRKQGLESSNLITFVDFTKSNMWQGKKTFGGKNLHDVAEGYNPYQYAIHILGKTLAAFDDDGLIPAFGFGDLHTRGDAVFPFNKDGKPCKGFEAVLQRYANIVPYVTLCGPTSFAPAIYKAIDVVRETKSYHIAIIVADGVIDDEGMKQETIKAIVAASSYPLSIIMVGVGDGPWDLMREFDDELPERKFDNFQFVNFSEVVGGGEAGLRVGRELEVAFAHKALMEIPEQYRAIKKLGLFRNVDKYYQSRSKVVVLDFPLQVAETTTPPSYFSAVNSVSGEGQPAASAPVYPSIF